MYLQIGQASDYMTSHPGSRTQIWMSRGNYTEAGRPTDPTKNKTFHWYFISTSEAWTKPQGSTFVVVGDSIADGRAF